MQPIRLRGARTHNLKSVDLDLEPGTLVVIAGPSGAGKSSLALGTLYAEGQRRYIESFSAYARQFLERLARPAVDELDPVPAAVAVDRRGSVRTSRSTVGTMTDVADYAKTLWFRAAVLHCPGCGAVVRRDEPEGVASHLLEGRAGSRVVVTYPVVFSDAEHFVGVREALVAQGYRRVWMGGHVRDLDDVRPSDCFPSNDPSEGGVLDVVADRTVARMEDRARLVEALESAMRQGNGRADVHVVNHEACRLRFSSALHCANCDRAFRDASPGLFSFNSPVGACGTCRGFGRTIGVDWDRVLPDASLSLDAGAIRPWQGKATAWERKQLRKHAGKVGVPLDVPLQHLSASQRAWLIEGDALGWPRGWGGLRGWFRWLESKAYKMHVRVLLARYRKYEQCVACSGTRLKPEALYWCVDGVNLARFYEMPVAEAHDLIERLQANVANEGGDAAISLLLGECLSRLATLRDVGLGYLTLGRASRTLSGGETQRVALTSALGASLTGALFVLDEPTVGLHPRDVARLHSAVRRLSTGDNVTVIVEHDPDLLRSADRIIELGPGAGEQGGRVVFDGPPEALAKLETPTAQALRPGKPTVSKRRSGRGWLTLRDARGHNLRGVDLRVPIGAMTCVTGVSGSGKSSLIQHTLFPAVARALGQAADAPLPYGTLEGHDDLWGAVLVDQSPLGRTGRGNPATYMRVWEHIRRLYAAHPLSRERGYGAATFSFNVPGGRCEACKGEGSETVEMQFLADVTFSCPECGGRRFCGDVLEVMHHGASIADVLDMSVEQVAKSFGADDAILHRLSPLLAVGLGYLRLGQPLNMLSGGEAQRLRLAEAIARTAPGALVVLDEPTAGLHAVDVAPLLAALDRLVERGDTVVIVEHDMRLVAQADFVVDLGPEAGERGGAIVASGSPEQVAADKASVTAPFLAAALGLGSRRIQRPMRAAADRKVRSSGTYIEVTEAREHNLRGVSVSIPREQFVVVTGPSGSGKSTLAFDVVYAEGQRRYLETLSPYARQYLPQLPRPSVERVVGVPPSLSLEQRTVRGATNSTVATLTEVAHYLRLLWARVGRLRCPDCDVPIESSSPTAVADDLQTHLADGTRLTLLAPVIRGRKGMHKSALEKLRRKGAELARIDGTVRPLEPGMALDRYKEHTIEVVVATLRIGEADLRQSLEIALALGDGTAILLAGGEERFVSTKRACPSCSRGFPELDPRFFSFNTRQGGCERCEGHGVVTRRIGRGKSAREESRACPACEGLRLSKLARSVRVDGVRIDEVFRLSVGEAVLRLRALALSGRDARIGTVPVAEAIRRLEFLEGVGLGYLGLDRSADTLSGGEMQRVRLAAQLGSGLTGVLYVLDEPTIGLHPRDNARLLRALRALVARGNSVLVVEHDADTILAADHVIDMGPSGGRNGGSVLAEGSPKALLRNRRSVTGAALARPGPRPKSRRDVTDLDWLELRGASEHNLNDVDLRVPLGRLVAVTGVSGSGKSTLVREVLLRAVRRALGLQTETPGRFQDLRGLGNLVRAIEIDQSPIGRTPRSVPVTYLGVWDELRALLAATPEARARGYTKSRFSFNVAEGRCANCAGQGQLRVEMAFLPDVHIPCDACSGMRFSEETLAVRFHELHAGEILNLDVADATELFSGLASVATPLRMLEDLGLGYLKLGQPSNTLSGGEAQRLKLVSELRAPGSGATLYVMDEPTTGLHRDDVARLIGVLHRLVERGDTVVVIEHHTDVIASADWIVDLGPEGGAQGGTVVMAGTPAELMAHPTSYTGAALLNEQERSAPRSRGKASRPDACGTQLKA